MLAAVGPVSKLAQVFDVESVLPGRLIGQAAGSGGLGFCLRPVNVGESVWVEHALRTKDRTKAVARRRLIRGVSGQDHTISPPHEAAVA